MNAQVYLSKLGQHNGISSHDSYRKVFGFVFVFLQRSPEMPLLQQHFIFLSFLLLWASFEFCE